MPKLDSFQGRHRFDPLWLLALLGVAGQGCGPNATSQVATGKVTELTGIIGTRMYGGVMAFSPDGKTLALPNLPDGKVECWNLETGGAKVLVSSIFNNEMQTDVVVFSKNGRFLAVEQPEREITLWDLPAGTEHAHIPLPSGSEVYDMVFADDDQALVAFLLGTSEPEKLAPKTHDNSTVCWEVATGKKLKTVALGKDLLFQALSRDGRYAVLGNLEEQSVYDLATGAKVFAVNRPGRFLFSEDGSTLVSCDMQRLSLWEVPSGRELKRFDGDFGQLGYYPNASLSPDTRILAVGQGNAVDLISLETGKVLDRFECGPPLTVCYKVLFSPNGRILATNTDAINSDDQPVKPVLKLWKVPASW